jgi:formylglycine-generating enzyme required for sulfatase activity
MKKIILFVMILSALMPTGAQAQNTIPEIEMVKVDGGTFDMGCTAEQDDCFGDEKPVHQVRLSSFYMGKYEVTQALWKAVMDNNPSKFTGNDNLPVESVTWNDVQKFLQKLNALTGNKYCLPTEAQWEYAARGGYKSKGYKYSGSNDVNRVAWFRDNSGEQTHAVGQKSPNELGLYDMSGNVWEWCSDWYECYNSYAQTNPSSGTGAMYVFRGGSWNESARNSRASCRGYEIPWNDRRPVLGFRLALTEIN